MTPPSTIGKPIRCKAAVCWEHNKPLKIETVTIEPPKCGEIRVKMVSAGICATDVSFYRGIFPKMTLPFVPGHEGNAIVESVGEGVEDFQPGDYVIPLWNPECETCERCKNSKSNLCDKFMAFPEGKMLDGSTRISINGKPVYSQNSLSTFSEYSVSYTFCFVKINQKAPLLKLATFGCCVPTGYGAAVNTAKVHPGASVVIWGLGGVGLCVALGCKRSGASKIIGVDINPDKFEIGKRFGVTDFVNPSQLASPIVEVINEMTEGGADYSFLCVGNKQVSEDALLSCHPSCGTCVHLAVMSGSPVVGCRPIDLIYGRTWKGSFCGGYRGKTGIPQLVDSYMAGELPETDLLITNTIPLDSIQNGFEELMAGKQIRTIIQF